MIGHDRNQARTLKLQPFFHSYNKYNIQSPLKSEIKHRDHSMITFPDLGHEFHPLIAMIHRNGPYTRICPSRFI